MHEHTITIFVVEDDPWFNKLLVHTLSLNPDYIVKAFFSANEMLSYNKEIPAVVTLDYRLPDGKGEEVFLKIKKLFPETEVVIISEQENIETAVGLLRLGAYDYMVKAKDMRDKLLNMINNIRKNIQLKDRIHDLEREVLKKYDFSNTIIGESAAIKKIFGLMEKAITSDIPVTIEGETGTGKELVAKAIHYNSKRKNGPFVAVNVAAIPSELIESELFGHEKGSFTGAVARRIGKFEEAKGGTLFLDEIGEMDLPFQAKLLRTLQEKELTRIGSNLVLKTDCRIIVATHRNLKEEVKNGKFREDLYYRVFGLPVELPPLRDREKDILILAKYFLNLFCKENSLAEKKLTEDAQKKLLSHAFPGNVRELKAVMDLAAVMSNGNDISANDISLNPPNGTSDIFSNGFTLREYDLQIVNKYLKKFDNNIKLVAEKLDISQSTIYRMLKKSSGDSASRLSF